MITITKQMRTETAHRLLNYNGRCAHLHGHSYLWEVTATAPQLDSRGMVADFKDLKAAMHEVLDPLDHALVLCTEDPILPIVANQLATNGERLRLHSFIWNPTAEEFAAWAASMIQQQLDNNGGAPVTITEVTVWETATSFAKWVRGASPK
jgi:6-pyruvoyltetrahydropterin/6-carboxytetrahydropterin synthase